MGGSDLKTEDVREEAAMTRKKRYEVKGACPQCACGSIYHLTAEEIEAKTIDKENIEITCPECGQVHREQIKSVCPEFARDCHL